MQVSDYGADVESGSKSDTDSWVSGFSPSHVKAAFCRAIPSVAGRLRRSDPILNNLSALNRLSSIYDECDPVPEQSRSREQVPVKMPQFRHSLRRSCELVEIDKAYDEAYDEAYDKETRCTVGLSPET